MEKPRADCAAVIGNGDPLRAGETEPPSESSEVSRGRFEPAAEAGTAAEDELVEVKADDPPGPGSSPVDCSCSL